MAPSTTYTLEFFGNAALDPTGFGQDRPRTAILRATYSAGNANFTLTLPNPIPGGQFVTATATDPNNNTSEFSQGLAVTTMADLALSATGIPNPVVQGNDLTYTLTVTNGGTVPTVRTTLTDTLPSGVTLVSATGSPSQSGNTLTFALGTLSPVRHHHHHRPALVRHRRPDHQHGKRDDLDARFQPVE